MSENIENTPPKQIISRFHGKTPDTEKIKKLKVARSDLSQTFDTFVSGWQTDLASPNFKADHSGRDGHALERRLGCGVNNENKPDFKGFEIKSCFSYCTKITMFDVTPDVTIEGIGRWWSKVRPKSTEVRLDKQAFLELYGSYNEKKERYSWTVEVSCKSYNRLNQMLKITKDGVFIIHNNGDDHQLFGWSHDLLKKRVENKFCVNGFAICKRNKDKVYSDFFIGKPITYCNFLDGIQSGNVFLGPGTYMGNWRPYMLWKAKKSWLESVEFATDQILVELVL